MNGINNIDIILLVYLEVNEWRKGTDMCIIYISFEKDSPENLKCLWRTDEIV